MTKQLLDELEAVRQEGNRLFAEQNWNQAIRKYSNCISRAGVLNEGIENSLETADEDIKSRNNLVALAHSNRAEAWLRLKNCRSALADAESALNTPLFEKHIKTLVRKGKAAHGLESYGLAREAFESALKESKGEGDRSIRKLLKDSTVADEQSRNGNYDSLVEFFCRGCTGEIPSCADFVGPVEIRRVNPGHGRRRGLFATRSLEPGELVLVSNPLAAVRERCERNQADGEREEGGGVRVSQKFLEDLVDGMRESNLQKLRFVFLACDDIPSMELYRPGRGRCDHDPSHNEVDVDFVYEFASKRLFRYFDFKTSLMMLRNAARTELVGLWMLPAFANHSCAPNCQHSFVGKTFFLRAARRIAEGEQLTVSYVSDHFEDVSGRADTLQSWMFTCECERCVVERRFPQLAKIAKAVERRRRRHSEEVNKQRGSSLESEALVDVEEELSNGADEVEAVIQSRGWDLPPRQQAWIRASFTSLYLAKLLSGSPRDYYESFRLVVEAQSSVYLTPAVLDLAVRRLEVVDKLYSKYSQAYRDALDQVRGMFTVFYGRLPDMVIDKLIKLHFPKDSP